MFIGQSPLYLQSQLLPTKTDYSSKVSYKTVLVSESEPGSHFTTDGQSASLSWHKAPIWGLRPDLYYCLTVTVLFFVGAFSDAVGLL
jgi:hypothetical protein